jgi:hypothetical protein
MVAETAVNAWMRHSSHPPVADLKRYTKQMGAKQAVSLLTETEAARYENKVAHTVIEFY